MANYTEQDVMAAAEQGLITEQDAEYLLSALQPSNVPMALGAAAGAALGGGVAGMKLLGKGAQKAASQGVDGLGPITARAAPPTPRVGSLANYGFTGAAGLAGGAAGGFAGAAMTPPGQGVQGQSGPGGMDRDMAMRMLIDPQVPAQQKREILKQLQAMDEQMPPSEQGYGEEGGGMAGTLMGIGGALGGGLAGGMSGAKLGARMTPKMGQPFFPPKEGANAFMNGMRGAGSFAASPSPMAGGLGLAGAAAGGFGGAALGDAMFGQSSPYEEPF